LAWAHQQGIEFVSFSERLDTSTAAGKLVFPVLGAGAELERSVIVERVMAGLRDARAKGKQFGRPKKINSFLPSGLARV
jgi:DNA invertase Pin-like site-specific DNA recombinase